MSNAPRSSSGSGVHQELSATNRRRWLAPAMLSLVWLVLSTTGCTGPGRFISLRINPRNISRTARDAARELVHGVLHTIGRVVDVILR